GECGDGLGNTTADRNLASWIRAASRLASVSENGLVYVRRCDSGALKSGTSSDLSEIHGAERGEGAAELADWRADGRNDVDVVVFQEEFPSRYSVAREGDERTSTNCRPDELRGPRLHCVVCGLKRRAAARVACRTQVAVRACECGHHLSRCRDFVERESKRCVESCA